MSKTQRLSMADLHHLIKNKLIAAGLKPNQAEEVANHLTFADASGVHSHGAIRVEYYAERIAKGGTNLDPKIQFEKTGSSTGIIHGDNGMGHYVANRALRETMQIAKETGVAIIGISRVGHTGMLSYYVRKIAKENLIGLAMCQSDPMAVPFGGKEIYYGTNPLAFSAPRQAKEPVVFDMATTVQAWGKILDARSKNEGIPETWAVDKDGIATTDPYKVQGLLPIAGPKGYGLMMIVDILSGILLGLPFGNHVSSMYTDLTTGRNLGQLYIAIDPERFVSLEQFKESIEQSINELHKIKPSANVPQVYYPGELSKLNYEKSLQEGIQLPSTIVAYLESDRIHSNQFAQGSPFAD